MQSRFQTSALSARRRPQSVPALMLVCGLMAAPVLADEPQPVGDQTRHWLDLQASGTVASPEERNLPGELADRSYQRYADSFSQPIPETFEREGFVSDSGGD